MRRLLLTASLSALFLGATSPALWDIGSYPQKGAIEYLHAYGVVDGYADGSFRPYATINRAEFLKILMLSAFGEESYGVADRACFKDFTGREQWYWVYACAAKQRGIISGHPDGTFRGEDTIILAEALKITLEAWDVPLPQYFREPDNWYEPYMTAASEKGIFQLFPFAPDFLMTRGDMAALIVKMNEPIVGTLQPGDPIPKVPTLPSSGPAICGNGTEEFGEQCDDGNTSDGDGCSSICIVVGEAIRHGSLRIEQRTLADASMTSGSTDVSLLQFDVMAGRQDVYITQLKFRATVGTLVGATNYRLYVDRDDDGVAETLFGQAVPQGTTLPFTNLSILVRDGLSTRVELRADIISALDPFSIAVGFDTSVSDFVEGVDKSDGNDVTGIELNNALCTIQDICWIAVYTQTPRVISVGVQGNLYVTKDSQPVVSRQLLGGTTTDTLLRLRFYATAEDIEVSNIAIEGGGPSVDNLKLYMEGETNPFATARTSQCDTVNPARFCTVLQLLIPRNTEKRVIVKATMRGDNGGAVSGDTVALTLSPSTTGIVAIEADGKGSGQELDQNDGDSNEEGEIFIGTNTSAPNSTVVGPTHDVVFAKISDITDIHTDSDNSPVPSGTADVAMFRINAPVHYNNANGLNDATLKTLVFTVVATNVLVDSSSFKLFNKSAGSLTTNCTASASTGIITVTCAGLENSATNTHIESGEYIDLGLRVTVSDPHVTGVSTLQVSLNDLGDRGDPGTVVWTDGNATFNWVDIAKTVVTSTLYRRS